MIEELKRLQGSKTQAKFARELGISPASLCRIYSGQRRIGPGLARRIKARYPVLTWRLAEWLLDDGHAA